MVLWALGLCGQGPGTRPCPSHREQTHGPLRGGRGAPAGAATRRARRAGPAPPDDVRAGRGRGPEAGTHVRNRQNRTTARAFQAAGAEAAEVQPRRSEHTAPRARSGIASAPGPPRRGQCFPAFSWTGPPAPPCRALAWTLVALRTCPSCQGCQAPFSLLLISVPPVPRPGPTKHGPRSPRAAPVTRSGCLV